MTREVLQSVQPVDAPFRRDLRPIHTQRLVSMLACAWRWLAAKRQAQLDGRQMRMVESVQLGEKRFVSLLEVDGQRFLIGGAAGQVTLLTRIDSRAPSADPKEPE